MELYFSSREEWRKWLSDNYTQKEGIWFIFYKKTSGKKSVPYADAVEEALCFGWIDGKLKRINDDYYIQRFTPRRQGSNWSLLNISRAEKMISEGKMMSPGMEEFRKARREDAQKSGTVRAEMPQMPDDLLTSLRSNQLAFDNFMNFPPSTKRIYLLWLNDAKKPETRVSRISKITERAEKNIKTAIL